MKAGDRFRARQLIGDPRKIGAIAEGTELTVREFLENGQAVLEFDEPTMVRDDDGHVVPGVARRAVSYPAELHEQYFEPIEAPDAG